MTMFRETSHTLSPDSRQEILSIDSYLCSPALSIDSYLCSPARVPRHRRPVAISIYIEVSGALTLTAGMSNWPYGGEGSCSSLAISKDKPRRLRVYFSINLHYKNVSPGKRD